MIVIDGNADYGVGQYCYGGTVVVHGNAGDFTATMNKGATIIVNGDVGDEAGTYMLKGDLIVVGNAGRELRQLSDPRQRLHRRSMGEHRAQHQDRAADRRRQGQAAQRTSRLTRSKPTRPLSEKIVAASEKPFYN